MHIDLCSIRGVTNKKQVYVGEVKLLSELLTS